MSIFKSAKRYKKSLTKTVKGIGSVGGHISNRLTGGMFKSNYGKQVLNDQKRSIKFIADATGPDDHHEGDQS